MNLSWIHDPVMLVINALAAYRLTRLWIQDSLPPLPKIRQWLQIKLKNSPLIELTDCPWCVGFWIATGTTLVASTGAWWPWVAVPLAISSIIGFLATRN